MPTALIAFGANQGDAARVYAEAAARLALHPQIEGVTASPLLSTAPVGGPADQPRYANGAIRLTTRLDPVALFRVLQLLENDLGRKRDVRWGPRPIDLDLLLYDDLQLASAELTIPHPRMAFRRFVLDAADEVASDLRHPGLGQTIGELRRHLQTTLPYVAVAGVPGSGSAELAARAADAAGATLLADPAGTELAAWTSALADSPGQAAEGEIRFLGARRDQLLAAARARDAAAIRADTPLLSAYWLPQSLAVSKIAGPGAETDSLAQAVEQAIAETPTPRLTTVVVSSPSERRLAALEEALLDVIRTEARGPVLRLENQTPDEAHEELSAALAAIRLHDDELRPTWSRA